MESMLLDAAPTAAIARRAGVGIAALFRRYPTKEELLRQMSIAGMRQMISTADEALTDPDPWNGFTSSCDDAWPPAVAPCSRSPERSPPARSSSRSAISSVKHSTVSYDEPAPKAAYARRSSRPTCTCCSRTSASSTRPRPTRLLGCDSGIWRCSSTGCEPAPMAPSPDQQWHGATHAIAGAANQNAVGNDAPVTAVYCDARAPGSPIPPDTWHADRRGWLRGTTGSLEPEPPACRGPLEQSAPSHFDAVPIACRGRPSGSSTAGSGGGQLAI
jgi:AcrR family transcriptional regulator